MDHGFISSGVDPAETVRLESFKSRVNVKVDFWTEKLGQELEGFYDVITACNVFAHNLNPLDFLKGCYHALTEKGYLIIEMPYAPRYMIDMPNEGHVYHEHQNYFTVNSLLCLATRADFWITNIEERPIHGGSIRVWMQKAENFRGPWQGPNPKVQEFINKEKDLGLYNLETYVRFEHTLRKNWEDLASILLSYHKQDYLIVGYGASAKSTTLLNGPFKNYLRMAPKDVIDFIIDDNPRKGGKFTPGTGIYIADTKDCHFPVSTTHKIAFLNLAYNFSSEIKEKIKRLRLWGKDDILIEFVPKVNVSKLHD
jgi:SAM-dependent methyltransferase